MSHRGSGGNPIFTGGVVINGVPVNSQRSPQQQHITKIPKLVLTRGSMIHKVGGGRGDELPLSNTNSSSPTKYEPMGYIDWKKSPVRKSNNAALLSNSKNFA